MTSQRSGAPFSSPTSPASILIPVAREGRVDVLVSHAIAGWSRRRVHDLFGHGAVRINGQRARKGDRVRAGDRVTVDQSFLPSELAASPELPVAVLHADASLVAVDKPAGMPSIARRITDTDTVANFLVARFPELRDASPNPLEAGMLHRLDTATSGVLVAARTRAAYEQLRQRFVRTAIKDYLAVVHGLLARTDRISLPIAHMPRRPRRMRVCTNSADAHMLAARPAETTYRTIASDADYSLLAIRIRTGVRHQIRVHLASAGHPIVGDTLYGRPALDHDKAARLLLHAYRVRLPHPERAASFDCVAEIPREFAAVLSARRWRSPRSSDWDDL
jgi:23S rRNA pseudouridine1911/1915/1917 synthase